MNVLVAGAGGYLGTTIVQTLSFQKHNVVALDLDEAALNRLHHYTRETVTADVTHPEQLSECMQNIDVVISTIGLATPKKNRSYWDVDYNGNLNLLEEAIRSKVKKFIFISVINADKKTFLPPVVQAKRAFEKQLISSGLQWVIYRPTGYFKDIITIFKKMAAKGKVIILGTGDIKTNPLHPHDFANCIAENLGRSNEIIEIGGPEVYTYKELGLLAFEGLNKKPKIKYKSIAGFKCFLRIAKVCMPKLYPVFIFSLWCMTNDMVAQKTGVMKISHELTKKD